jgi:hypothetical protein
MINQNPGESFHSNCGRSGQTVRAALLSFISYTSFASFTSSLPEAILKPAP